MAKAGIASTRYSVLKRIAGSIKSLSARLDDADLPD
jgi:hypothetical protein